MTAAEIRQARMERAAIWAARHRQRGDHRRAQQWEDTMDRYAVVEVNLASGRSRTLRVYTGESGADRAHAHADRGNATPGFAAFVVGLDGGQG